MYAPEFRGHLHTDRPFGNEHIALVSPESAGAGAVRAAEQNMEFMHSMHSFESFSRQVS